MSITIRTMSVEELSFFMNIIYEQEKWNLGKYDFEPYFNYDPEGYKVLLLDEKPIGCISIVKHTANFAFIGLFFILENYRNKQYGTLLWNHAMQSLKQRLHDEANIGLYAVKEQITRYKKYGFESIYSNHRYEWNIQARPLDEDTIKSVELLTSNSTLFKRITNYRNDYFSKQDLKLLEGFTHMPGVKLFILLNENTVEGFGMIRPCQEGYRIGPLYANDLNAAKILAMDLASMLRETGGKIILDMPSANYFTNLFAEYFNLTYLPNLNTEAMFIKDYDEILTNIHMNFAIASLEIG